MNISLSNDATLSSFERRAQMGIKPAWHIPAEAMIRRMKYDTRHAFTRVVEKEELEDCSDRLYEQGVMCMELTSETLGRVDAEIYANQCQFTGGCQAAHSMCVGVEQNGIVNYLLVSLNVRKVAEPWQTKKS